jgi:hypothetical protein
MDTKHGSRVATRRVGLIVTVLVAVLTLGACGTGGANTEQAASPQPVAVEPVADGAADRTGSLTVGSDEGSVKSDRSSGELGAGVTAQTKVLHRFGEVVEPGAGTGSWSSMDEFMDFVIQDANGYWQWIFWDYGMESPSVNYVFPAPGQVIETSCGSTDDQTAFYCDADDLIVVSQQLAIDLWDGEYTYAGRDVGEYSGDMAVAFVVAHELAHSLQGQLGYLETPTARSAPSSRRTAGPACGLAPPPTGACSTTVTSKRRSPPHGSWEIPGARRGTTATPPSAWPPSPRASTPASR